MVRRRYEDQLASLFSGEQVFFSRNIRGILCVVQLLLIKQIATPP
jgi:hypothetical protein